MFNKIGNRCGWGKFESCLSNGQNELQVFFKPCSHWKSVRKKKPTFCSATNSFPMKWYLRNKPEIPSPGLHHLAKELLKVLQNATCFLRLLKVTSFKCSSNAANVSDPVFLLFIISLTSSLTKNVKIEKNCRVQAVPSRLGTRHSKHSCSLRKNLTLVSPQNDIWGRSPEIPYLWCVTTQIWVMLLIG